MVHLIRWKNATEQVFHLTPYQRRPLRESSTLALKDEKNLRKWHHQHRHKI